MPFDIGETAGRQAENLVGTGIGLLLEGHNDRRQLRQQEKLNKLQVQSQKEMGEFNMAQQKEMWDYTNYENQKKHLEEAGLNPALMYGMSGGGGATANVAPGQVAAEGAPKGGHEAIEGMGLMLQQHAQLELLNAQKRNIDADTENKKADTENKGADTKLKGSQITKIAEETKNLKVQRAGMEIANEIANIERTIREATSLDQIRITDLQAQKMQEEYIILNNEAEISDQTVKDKIEQIRAEVAQTITKAALNKANIQLNNQQIIRLIEQTGIDRAKITNEMERNQFNKTLSDKLGEYVTKQKELTGKQIDYYELEKGVKAASEIMESFLPTSATRNTIKGFRR